MKTKRLREAREAGLVLPQSGYEMSNDEMMYVDGGWFWRAVGIAFAAVAVTVVVVGTLGAGTAVVGAVVAKKAVTTTVVAKGVVKYVGSKTAANAISASGVAGFTVEGMRH